MPKLRIRRKNKKGSGELSSFQILWKTWNGKISIVLIIIMLLLAIGAVGYYGITGLKDYTRKTTYFTYLYPENQPPCWAVDNAPSFRFSLQDMQHNVTLTEDPSQIPIIVAQGNSTVKTLKSFIKLYKKFKPLILVDETYLYKFVYSTEGEAKPSDVALALIFHIGENSILRFQGSDKYIAQIYIDVHLERPDGQKVYFFYSKPSTTPGTDLRMIGGYDKNVHFLNKNYPIFPKPTSLNSLTNSSNIPVTPYFFDSLERIENNIVKNATNKSLVQNQFEKFKPGVRMMLTVTPDDKVVVDEGEYTFKIEIVYLVDESLVATNGTFDYQKAKQNDAIVEPIIVDFFIKANCGGFFGTDNYGRPIGLGLLFGLPYAFILGFIVTFTSTFLGAFYGSAAGYWKDIKGEALMRVVDVVNSLPFLPILIALSVAIGTINLWMLAVLMIALFWAGPVIVVRSMALQISEQVYVEAAKAVGASTWRILFKHVFPQIFPYAMAIAVLSMPGIIIAEASLSLLGFGDPSAPTWGKMLQGAYDVGAVQLGWWWYYLFPGLALVIFSAAFLMLGRALEPIVAPKLIK